MRKSVIMQGIYYSPVCLTVLALRRILAFAERSLYHLSHVGSLILKFRRSSGLLRKEMVEIRMDGLKNILSRSFSLNKDHRITESQNL